MSNIVLNLKVDQEDQDKTDLNNAAMIRFLTAGNTVFTVTGGNMLSVTVEDEKYPIVYLHCSFPHTNKKIYISVRTIENKEIGMIRSLEDFPEETVSLLEEQVQIRYFAPEITKVSKIKEEFGYSYWETETSAGFCRFTVRSGGGNVKFVSDKKLLIIDVDGNRFVIEDLGRISDKEYKMVEMCT
jgi:hypothetical protein